MEKPMFWGASIRRLQRVLWVGMLVLCCGCATDPARPAQLRLATGTPGGTYHGIGEQLSRYANRTGFQPHLSAVATRGTEDNLERLRQGEAELALITQDALMVLPEEERDAFRVIGPLYRGGAQFVLRMALVRTSTVADLQGVHLYPGSAGSGTEASTLQLLETLGIQPNYAPASRRTLGYDASAEALAKGRFDALVLSGGPPVGALSRLLESNPHRFVILYFSPEQIERVTSQMPGLYPTEIAGGLYPEHPRTIPTVGKQTVLVARSSLDPAIVEALAQMIVNGIREPGAGLRADHLHPMLQGLTPEFWNQPMSPPPSGTTN